MQIEEKVPTEGMNQIIEGIVVEVLGILEERTGTEI